MDKDVLKGIVLEVKKEALEKGYFIDLSTTGRSMYPFLKTNNKIELIKCDIGRLKRGDIIVYKIDSKLVAHRLVRKIKSAEGECLIMKGDSNFNLDRPIDPGAVMGKVIKIRKRLFCISLDGIYGSVLNTTVLFLSVSKILPSVIFILRKAKRLIKRCVVSMPTNF